MRLTTQQRALTKRAPNSRIFLEGIAGTGKTTASVRRLEAMLKSGIASDSVLVIVAQRALAFPYEEMLRKPKVKAGGKVDVETFGSIAVKMVELFFPLVAEQAGFAYPDEPPTFLSLETSQYYMTKVIGPVIDEFSYFDTITIDRNRLYSQILDNLNKAAVVGFPYTQIGERLRSAWVGEVTQQRIYDEVQDCANRFRAFCLDNNLLDFSLQLELFVDHIWKMPACRDYLVSQYKHLIIDNVEEDNPAMHYILSEWLLDCDSALVIYDSEAGYRRFLGADPTTAHALLNVCDEQIIFSRSFVTSPDLETFGYEMARSLKRSTPEIANYGDPREVLVYDDHRYQPEMIEQVAREIDNLVHGQGVEPREIVVVAPFLPDALRFSLMNRLEARDIAVRSHRPSRALREEPAAQCLLTLAQIAHPQWGIKPSVFDVVYALMEAIDGLDLVRAQILASIVYRQGILTSFDDITEEDKQSRITFVIGKHYEKLRKWLQKYIDGEPVELDIFFTRLFGEVLSQKGFGFHNDFDAAEVAVNLVDSAKEFRWTVKNLPEGRTAGHEYVEMVQGGVIANQYVRNWQHDIKRNAVLLAPAYTFIMNNQPVDYQFWMNVGSGGWWERLYQPLTHPHVLSAQWEMGKLWTDDDEFEVRQEAMYRLLMGLVRRCRKQIYLGFSQLGEQGTEQRGPLMRAVQGMMRRITLDEGTNDDV